jgi:hypothetical protein
MTPCFPIYDRHLRPAFGRRDVFERFGCLVPAAGVAVFLATLIGLRRLPSRA